MWNKIVFMFSIAEHGISLRDQRPVLYSLSVVAHYGDLLKHDILETE